MKKKSERVTIDLSLLSLISFFVFLGAITSAPIFNIIALAIILVFFFRLGYHETK